MKISTKEFNKTASATLKSPDIQASLGKLYDGFYQARERAAESTHNWEELRNRARTIKSHTIENLDYYLEMVETNVIKNGGNIYFAKDASAGSRYIVELARDRGVKMVIKGKSMLSEEMGLNTILEEAGIESVETDLGEYIMQIAEEPPYHIIAPAVNKSKEDVASLFHDRLGSPFHTDISDLAAEARDRLREKFLQADMGITGANFMVAETGTLVLVTNEGNGRMSTSMPRIHVAIMGMEKVIPSMDQLGTFLKLLIRSATGQHLSSYVTTVNGPKTNDEEDGPEEFHLVVVDNGRSRILEDPELRESLFCLRCGACLNACPVYRKVGGHAYGWVYSGPIGAVVNPLLTGVQDAKDLPFASSLCGACREVCPVKINIPRMLLRLRNDLSEGTSGEADKKVSWIEKLMIKTWRFTVSNAVTFGLANKVGRMVQLPFLRGDRIQWLPLPLSGWTKYRDFPKVSDMPFSTRWSKYLRKGNLRN